MVLIHLLLFLICNRITRVECTNKNECKVEYHGPTKTIQFECPISTIIELMVDDGHKCSFKFIHNQNKYERVEAESETNSDCFHITATVVKGVSKIEAVTRKLSKPKA